MVTLNASRLHFQALYRSPPPFPLSVMGVTVDWSANNIYWTDAVYQWIMMAPMDNRTTFRIVLDEMLTTPHGIAVYPQARCVCVCVCVRACVQPPNLRRNVSVLDSM